VDNLTHSLIGAVIGQAGLKRRTGLAMPALIIGANLPDIDATCTVYGIESLAMRRGITHGPIAMVVLPLLLAGALRWFDRWQERRGTRPDARLPVRFGWLLALSLIGCLSHPAADWLNSYGIRLLEPFSSKWFYGDVLFIIDPWLWAILGGGLWLSLRRERGGAARPLRPAQIALLSGIAYVALNLGISRHVAFLAASDAPYAPVNVASPVPLAFWQREVLWRTADGHYGFMPCTVMGCRRYPMEVRRTNENVPGLRDAAAADPAARAFLFWSRMPVAELHEDRIVLRDQRFMDPRVGDRFSVTLRPPQ
jgi:inner membrane protein